jgi:hypothetical protein
VHPPIFNHTQKLLEKLGLNPYIYIAYYKEESLLPRGTQCLTIPRFFTTFGKLPKSCSYPTGMSGSWYQTVKSPLTGFIHVVAIAYPKRISTSGLSRSGVNQAKLPLLN